MFKQKKEITEKVKYIASRLYSKISFDTFDQGAGFSSLEEAKEHVIKNLPDRRDWVISKVILQEQIEVNFKEVN